MKDPISVKRKIPFAFALEELEALSPMVKSMFGGFAIYIGEKLVLFLYDQEKWPDFKGVSLATTPEHYRDIAQEFSSKRDAETQKIGKHPWLLIPAGAVDFEEQVLKACEMILNGDPRIGRAPEAKRLRPSQKETSRKKI
jgi:hypothetical protein